jgi:hypothetical protein
MNAKKIIVVSADNAPVAEIKVQGQKQVIAIKKGNKYKIVEEDSGVDASKIEAMTQQGDDLLLQYADGTELLLQDFHMSGNAASVELPSGVWDDKLVAIENSNNVTVALSQSGSASLVSVLAGAPISEAMALSTAYGAPAMAGSTSAVLLGVLGLGGAAIVLGANTGNDKSPTPQPDASVTAAPAGVHTITLSDDTGTAGDRRTTDGAVKITLNLGNSLTLASDEVLQVSADGGKTWVQATGTGTSWSTANNAVALGASGNITARIVDTAGNIQAISITANDYTLDTVAPVSPTLISVTDNYGLTQGTINAGDTTDDITPTVRFSLTGTQAVVGDSIQLYNGSAAVGSAQVITLNDMVNGYVHVTPSALYTGTYSFNAKLIDAAGNASDASNSHAATLVITANQRLQGMSGGLDDPIFLGDPYTYDTQTLALSDGGYVIAWSAPTSDSEGADVFLQRYTAGNEALAGVQRLQGASGSLTDARVSLTALSAGQYLVAWESQTAGAQGFNIQLQRFDASNLPDGPAQVLSANSTAEDRAPKVTTLTNGGYVVAWQADIADGQGKDVFFQVYGANGAAVPGGVHQIGAETGNFDDGMPNMAALSDGGFVISWSAQTASSGQDVFVQRYDHLIQAIDAPIRLEGAPGTTLINADSFDMGSSVPSVTALSDGAYVAVWAAATAQTPDVFMQRFGADNAPLGGVIQLGSGDYTSVWYPKVITLSNGGFVVAWTASKADDLEAWDVYLRSFDSQGNSVVTHRLSAASQPGSYFWDTDVHLTALTGGGYVVSWQGADANRYDIYTQQYTANDTAVGPVQSLRSDLSSDVNYTPTISAMLDGGYVVSWSSLTTDGQGLDLFAQRFDAQGNPWQGMVSISNDTGTAGDRITTDSQVQVTLTLANALTLAGGETLQVSADGGTTWVATTGTGTSWSTVDNAVALQAGTGSVTARIVNGAGNASAITLNSNNYVNVVASRIDLGTETAANSLNLVLADVLDMSGINQFNSGNGWTGLDALVQRHQLVVDGSANDAINLEDHANWTLAGTASSSISGTAQTYDVYNHNTAEAQLLVDANMSKTWQVI